jgi:hypothetical protein
VDWADEVEKIATSAPVEMMAGGVVPDVSGSAAGTTPGSTAVGTPSISRSFSRGVGGACYSMVGHPHWLQARRTIAHRPNRRSARILDQLPTLPRPSQATEEERRAVVSAFATNTSVASVHFGFAGVGDALGVLWAKVLQSNSTITALHLESNAVGTATIDALGAVLASGTTRLRELKLANQQANCSQLAEEGFARALEHAPTLLKLTFDFRSTLASDLATKCVQACMGPLHGTPPPCGALHGTPPWHLCGWSSQSRCHMAPLWTRFCPSMHTHGVKPHETRCRITHETPMRSHRYLRRNDDADRPARLSKRASDDEVCCHTTCPSAPRGSTFTPSASNLPCSVRQRWCEPRGRS